MADSAALLSHFYLKWTASDETAVSGDDRRSRRGHGREQPASAGCGDGRAARHEAASGSTTLRWSRGRRSRSRRRRRGREGALFDGEIVELEPDFAEDTHRLIVRAFDRLHRLSRGRHVRSFLNVSDGDLVQKIAREVGLQAQVGPTVRCTRTSFRTTRRISRSCAGARPRSATCCSPTARRCTSSEPAANDGPIELQWATTLMEFRPRLTTVSQITDVDGARLGSGARGRRSRARSRTATARRHVGEQRKGGQLAQSAFNLEAPHPHGRPSDPHAGRRRPTGAGHGRPARRRSSSRRTACARATPRSSPACKVKITAVGERFTRHVLRHGGARTTTARTAATRRTSASPDTIRRRC